MFSLFALRKGTVVTEYGGEVLTHGQSVALRGQGKATHIRSLFPLTSCLDSRVHGEPEPDLRVHG